VKEQAPLGNHEWPFTRILLAQHFPGWRLDYIDGLSQKDVNNIFAVLNAQADAKRSDESSD